MNKRKDRIKTKQNDEARATVQSLINPTIYPKIPQGKMRMKIHMLPSGSLKLGIYLHSHCYLNIKQSLVKVIMKRTYK